MDGIVRRREHIDSCEEIIDFANFVFSYSSCPHEFKTLHPKTYSDARTQFPEHFTVRENGRIRGLVGLLEYGMRVLSETLRVGYIGTVSVHPYTRGRGYMRDCMARAMDFAREQGDDILVLDGLRQRYGYYGFESAGIAHRFTVTKTNCRHALDSVNAQGIDFVPMAEAGYMDEVYTLWADSPVTCDRGRDNFAQICSSWYDVPLVILRGEEFLGYCVVSADRATVHELRLKDSGSFGAVIKAFFSAFAKDTVTLFVPPFRAEDIRSAARICETASLTTCNRIRVLHWDKVVKAYLKLKQSIEGTLTDGRAVIGIADGEKAPLALRIEVLGGNVACACTQEAPAVVLTGREAISLLFAPVTYADVSGLPACVRSWFPLPYYMEHSDRF